MRKWDADKLHKKLEEWVNRPQNKKLLFDDEIKEIEQGIQSGDSAQIVHFGASLEFIAKWESTNGALSVLNGNADGWHSLGKSAVYLYSSLRIILHYFDHDTNPAKSPRMTYNHAALSFAHLLALGYYSEANWVGKRLAQGLLDGAFEKWQAAARFPPFMIRLHEFWSGNYAAQSSADSPRDPYQQIIGAWDGEAEEFKNALREACDYHCQRIDGNNDDHEFYDSVYAIFPIEILAVKRVRQALNLEMPELDHPLMQSLLAVPPENPPFASDDLLDRLVAHVPDGLLGKPIET